MSSVFCRRQNALGFNPCGWVSTIAKLLSSIVDAPCWRWFLLPLTQAQHRLAQDIDCVAAGKDVVEFV
jgi:hypothetical protein